MRGMTDLTDAYENAAHIPGAETYPPRWEREGDAFRREMRGAGRLRELAPEGAPPCDLILPADPPAGLCVFVHGGYWKAMSPDVFAWIARGPVARGWAVALARYTLAPGARIAAITREVAAAVEAAAAAVPDVPIVVTGHSAGGHLSARMACEGPLGAAADRLAKVVPISPLSDLAPLMRCEMNAILGIDEDEAAAESPARLRPRDGVAAEIWVGGDERPAFLDQARWLAEAWDAPLTVLDGRHHFDVIDGLADPDDPLCRAVTPGA